jgi:O-antigen/teichoic acid export membrane protein
MFSSFMDMLSTRINTLVIGKFYSARDLGFYSRADSTQQLPVNLLSTVIGRVAFPLFSLTAHDPGLLLRGMRKAIKSAMFLNLPAMVGLVVVARPLVQTLFGERWLPAVPYLQVLALAGILWPLHILNLNYLKSTGQSRLFFNLEIAKKILAVVALLIGSPISVLAMAWSQVVVGCVSFFLNAHYTGKQLGYTPWKQLRDLGPVVMATLVMAVCTWCVPFMIALRPIWLLGVQLVVGVAVFGGVSFVLQVEPAAEVFQHGLQWFRRAILRRERVAA